MPSTVKDDDWSISASEEELKKVLTEIQNNVFKETLENECYKNFMEKLNIEIEKTVPSVSRRASLVRKRSKSRSSAIDRFITLSNEQKCLVLQAQYEEHKNQIELIRTNFEETLDLQKAISEELKARHDEILKNHNLFSKLVEKECLFANQVIPAEKVLRHSDDYCKLIDTQSDKLRLKNSSIKATLKKTKEQLRQKESGEVLSAIDFEQMKIDNNKCLAEIDEKNHTIQTMKITSARTLQILSEYKKKLSKVLHEQKYIKGEQNQRQEMQRRVQSEIILAKQELKLERALNEKFENQISSYLVPSVIDFVRLVSEEHALSSKQNIYSRRLTIAKVALRYYKKRWLQIQRSNLNEAL
ncbi:Coiled-coil domain-containing protein isoform 2 [Schistosoma japonicum]|uniref:Cilia- and flagella-associated protein 263 n=1 Tax=Schistosoma japonicum TaxID=6182 RepID=A0A4Z2DDD3_SCHJA|nr:Coiled-coil domain-containing protein isoform 2 [Schistosoma japonicum]